MSPHDLNDVIGLLMFYRILLGLVVKSILLQLFFGEFLNADETGCAEENDDGENSIHSDDSCMGQQWPNDDLLQQPLQESRHPEEGMDHPLEINLRQRRAMMEDYHQWDNNQGRAERDDNLAWEEQIRQQCYIEARREEEVQNFFTQLEALRQHEEQMQEQELRREMEAKKKDEEEQLRKAMEAKKKDEEEQLRKAMEAKKKDEEEQLRKAMEAKKKDEEEQLHKAMEAKKKDEEEHLRKAIEDKKKDEEEKLCKAIEAKKKDEEEKLCKAIEAKKKDKEEQLRKAIEAKKKDEEEKLRKEIEVKRLQIKITNADVSSELMCSEDLSSMQEQGDIHDGTYATKERKTQPLQRSINPYEELKKLQIQKDQNMKIYKKEMIDNQVEREEPASSAPNHQLATGHGGQFSTNTLEMGHPVQQDTLMDGRKTSPAEQVDGTLSPEEVHIKYDNEQCSVTKEQQGSMQIEMLDQLERDRGKAPNNQELQSVETQQMNSEGAAAPNHQLSADDSGQFSMTTSGDEKPWKKKQPNQQNSGDGKKNQASQTEETSPSQKWEKTHDG